MISTTDGQRWHAYADGQDAGTHPTAALAHAAARARHEQHLREQDVPRRPVRRKHA